MEKLEQTIGSGKQPPSRLYPAIAIHTTIY